MQCVGISVTNELSVIDLKRLLIICESFPFARAAPIGSLNCRSPFDDLRKKLIANYPEVLIGTLPKVGMKGNKMHIYLNDRNDIAPTKVLTARPIPINFRKEVNKIISKALEEGIIEWVSTPTEWCAPAFFVQKPHGSVCLVTDFTGLNRRVLCPMHPFPSANYIISVILNVYIIE